MNDVVLGLKAIWRKYERPILTAIQAGIAVFLVAAIDAISVYFQGGSLPSDLHMVLTVGGSAGLSALMLWIRTTVSKQPSEAKFTNEPVKLKSNGQHFK